MTPNRAEPLFAPKIAFVDVETTGMSPENARVTEVGVVLVRTDALGNVEVDEWSSLVDPGVPIPPEIRFLTGITNEMVAGAPSFGSLAPALAERLADAVFVAHHARFDYGFIKQEFARAGHRFGARTLCTVRLSRLLFPDRGPHSLDALILRHGLPVTDRHRALGDARVLWSFVQVLYRRFPADAIAGAVKGLLRHPALPAHLPAGALEEVPRAPGVYAFYGLNAHPLYIGKSRELRTRVASHFNGDHASERGLRLASETRRIEWQETAGDFSARLLEIEWIKTRLPSHNVALRRRSSAVLIRLDDHDPVPAYVKLDAFAPGLHGPFGSRAAARRMLIELARVHGLCLRCMKLERGDAGVPCFNRQIGRCAGACVGAESMRSLHERLAGALASLQVPAWPFDGAVALVDCDDNRFVRTWQVFDDWCHLGTCAGEDAARELAAAAPRTFDADVYALLKPMLGSLVTPTDDPGATLRCVPLGRAVGRRLPDTPDDLASDVVTPDDVTPGPVTPAAMPRC